MGHDLELFGINRLVDKEGFGQIGGRIGGGELAGGHTVQADRGQVGLRGHPEMLLERVVQRPPAQAGRPTQVRQRDEAVLVGLDEGQRPSDGQIAGTERGWAHLTARRGESPQKARGDLGLQLDS